MDTESTKQARSLVFHYPEYPQTCISCRLPAPQRGSMSLLQVLQHTVVKMRVADPHCVLQGTSHAIQLWSAPTGTSLELLQFQMKQKKLSESPRPCLWTTPSVNLRFYCNHLVCKWSELWFSRPSQMFPWYLKATGKQVLPMDCSSIKLKYSQHEKFHLMFSGSLWWLSLTKTPGLSSPCSQ